MSKRVITIGRQFGSNGRMIGRLLAKRLGVNFYDKELIRIASEQIEIPYDQLVLVDEKKESPWRYEADLDRGIKRQYRYEHIDQKLFQAQSDVIQQLAEKEDCVIVGRCADYVLRDCKTSKHVYLYAPYEVRLKTIMERQQLERKEAESLIKRVDKDRSYYYSYYTDSLWDDMENYDICLNTGAFVMDEILRILDHLYHYI